MRLRHSLHEPFTMRRIAAVAAFSALVGAFSASFGLLPSGTSQASASQATFLIPASDGYGIAECLEAGADCGQVVAGAWCESQGFARAVSFGVAEADEVTGAVAAPSRRNAARPISITCAH